MEGIPIRSARRGDIPSLLLLWQAMMKEHAALDARLAPHPRAREHMANEFSLWLADPHRVLVVAEENARLVVGFAAGVAVPGSGWQIPLRLGKLTDCFVVGARRRQGVGRRLAGRVLDLLYEDGVDTVRLAVSTRGEAAHAFWTSMGWEDLEEVLERPVDVSAPPAASRG